MLKERKKKITKIFESINFEDFDNAIILFDEVFKGGSDKNSDPGTQGSLLYHMAMVNKMNTESRIILEELDIETPSVEKQVIEFKNIANNKFKELFKIEDISNLFEDFKIKDLYKDEFEKDYLFKNIINGELFLGKIKDIKFIDDISDSFQYKIENLKNNQIKYLNSFLYSKTEIRFGNYYIFKM